MSNGTVVTGGTAYVVYLEADRCSRCPSCGTLLYERNLTRPVPGCFTGVGKLPEKERFRDGFFCNGCGSEIVFKTVPRDNGKKPRERRM